MERIAFRLLKCVVCAQSVCVCVCVYFCPLSNVGKFRNKILFSIKFTMFAITDCEAGAFWTLWGRGSAKRNFGSDVSEKGKNVT